MLKVVHVPDIMPNISLGIFMFNIFKIYLSKIVFIFDLNKLKTTQRATKDRQTNFFL